MELHKKLWGWCLSNVRYGKPGNQSEMARVGGQHRETQGKGGGSY